MTDGTELSAELNNPRQSGTANENHTSTTTPQLPQGGQSAQDRFLAAARGRASIQATRTFANTIDPYKEKLQVQQIRDFVQYVYFGSDHTQLASQWKLDEAENIFRTTFKTTYNNSLGQLSIESGATTEATRQLLIFARQDKIDDRELPQNSTELRASLRASICLLSQRSLQQENVNAEALNDLQAMIALYQKFYDEFEPAKEEDQ